MFRPIIYFVLPCFNEEECVKKTYQELTKKLKFLLKKRSVDEKSKIVFVDDGSTDNTWKKIVDFAKTDKSVICIKLAHNVGHQNALFAGLDFAKNYAEGIISMDADLQDNLEVIDKFLEKFSEGYEIVYGVRGDRKTDSWFKRNTAQVFYRLMRFLGVNLVYNSADCRLMSRRATAQLCKYTEVNLFLRGIVPLIGLKSTSVEYKRNERIAGKSKYTFRKMVSFAWDGVTSFSIKPMRLILFAGILISMISIGVLIYTVFVWALGRTVSGWAFTVCSLWILGGIQITMLGLIGEYIGKIYAEVKNRPRFFIDKVVKEGKEKNG